MKNTLAMLLAGGQGKRLNILARHRAKPAVPFAGVYRIIDITLSNIMNSYIDNVGILTQYRPSSLIDHIQTGESWELYGKNRSAVILPPYTGDSDYSWYAGTADAIYQNLNYISHFEDATRILIVSGDHIYKMDYSELINAHKEKNADVTIVAMEVPVEEASRFGTIITGENDRVVDFEEKPKNPKSNLVSLGIYIFNKDILIDELKKDALKKKSSHDFGKDILPSILDKQIFIYRFEGYWRDVGTIESYWETSMDLLGRGDEDPILEFDKWKITTNFNRLITADRNPTYVSDTTDIKNSLISEGCIIEGKIENSILSPGVKIGKGSIIKDSIIFHDTIIDEKVVIDKCIIDKNVVIERETVIGVGDLPGYQNALYPSHLSTGITIVGKGAHIPKKMQFGRNCILESALTAKDFDKTKRVYPDGTTILKS